MEIFKEKCSTQILLLRMVEIEEVHPEERAREEEKKANDRGGNGGDDGFRARTTGTRESAEDEEKEIIALATRLKSNGNEKFATSAFGEALKLYDDGVEVLSKEGECDDIDDSDESDEDDGDVDETTTTTTTTKTKGTEKEEEDEAKKNKADVDPEKREPTKREVLLATLHANAGACLMKLESFEECVRRCSKAIALHPRYGKAHARRAQAYEKLDDVERALEDYEKAVAIEEKENGESEDARRRMKKSAHREKVNALKPKVEEKREETKKEMFKQLRSLGDMVLGNFGLSCDNFKAEKDENTGGFSLKFVQEKAGETKTRVINENESNNNNNSAAAAATASK
jgi:tetratricopeptide (TPR) repeat protein